MLEASTRALASLLVLCPLSAPPLLPQAIQLLLSLLAALPVTAQLLADSQVAGLVAPLQHHSSAVVVAAARWVDAGWMSVGVETAAAGMRVAQRCRTGQVCA